MSNGSKPRNLAQQSAGVDKPSSKGEVQFAIRPFDLSSFKLEQATLEFRYDFALLFWDRAGTLWDTFQQRWPKLTLLNADPGKTAFRSGNATLSVELEAARMTVGEPDRSCEEFSRSAKDFAAAITKHLRIPLFKRIGFRAIYFKEFKDADEAAAAFMSLRLLKVPQGRKFDVSESPSKATYILRWESATKGTLLQLRAETRTVDFDPPVELMQFVKPVHVEKNGLVLDVDYYTVAPAEPAQVDFAEWIKHAVHLINRDARYLFED